MINESTTRDYSARVDDLIERQMSNWPMVAHNYEALKHVRTRTLMVGGSRIVLQFNPERIRSSAAKVDAASLRARKCFLCVENQPREQEMVRWEDFKIQVNPYPIFPRHLTIALMEHKPQLLDIGSMLRLAHDLPKFVIFYNGPKCGASAPDHMHFQAGNKGFLPLIDELPRANRQMLLDGDCQVSLVTNLARPFFLVEAQCLDDALRELVPTLRAMCTAEVKIMNEDALAVHEAMQNVLCWWDEGTGYHVIVFPRAKHRPSNYGSGPGQFTLSPASVDMGGVWAVPVERDFEALTARDVQLMFGELCPGSNWLEEIIKQFGLYRK